MEICDKEIKKIKKQTMNIQNHVTSLKLSKQLKEAGLPQEGELYWNRHLAETEWQITDENNSKISHWETYRALLASELMEILPEVIEKFKHLENTFGAWLSLEKIQGDRENKYMATYGDEGISYLEFGGKTSQDALAKMVLYFVKEKIINFEE